MERRTSQSTRLHVPARPSTSVRRTVQPEHPKVQHQLSRRVKQPEKPQSSRKISDRQRLDRYMSRVAKKTDILQKSLELSTANNKKFLVKTSIWQNIRIFISKYAINGVAIALLLVAGYVSIDAWLVNREIKAESSQSTDKDSATSHQDQEGKDETPLSDDMLNSYKVAPDLPRAIYIDKINVKARTLPMGINPDGSMQAPINISDAGWYSSSSKPGEVGAVVVDAHASGRLREGLFAYIDKLSPGDMITIERGDGTKIQYKVSALEEVPLGSVDMNKLLLPYGTSTQGLNLITCSGSYNKESDNYDHRTIVYAEQV